MGDVSVLHLLIFHFLIFFVLLRFKFDKTGDGDMNGSSISLANMMLLLLGALELNFLACQLDASYWQLYLQTGSDTPSSGTCSNYQTIHLPCLC